MPPNRSLHIVQLIATSKEYNDVLQKFDLTMRGQYTSIIKIERIQNPALYLQYVGRRKEMNKHNPQGHQNERLLFHGTSADTCPKINQNGFNRSFAGKNGKTIVHVYTVEPLYYKAHLETSNFSLIRLLATRLKLTRSGFGMMSSLLRKFRRYAIYIT